MLDTFTTITDLATAEYSEKRSKFLAFALPITSVDEAMEWVKSYEKEYYDARHVCYAYMIGPDRLTFRANDNGEPSGTAGRPILGQINSAELTDILVVVVRYFGGVKLGTSGLIQAYKIAAQECIANAERKECTIDELIDANFEYPLMNAVMRVVKEQNPQVLGQDFDGNCILHLRIRRSLAEKLVKSLNDIHGVSAKVLETE